MRRYVIYDNNYEFFGHGVNMICVYVFSDRIHTSCCGISESHFPGLESYVNLVFVMESHGK